MAYINFNKINNKTPLKETHSLHNCTDCIHKIKISDNLHKCSITHDICFIDYNQKEECKNKNTLLKERYLIIGIGYINEKLDNITIDWIGDVTFLRTQHSITDKEVFKSFNETVVPALIKQYSKFKNFNLVPIIMAESTDNCFYKIFDNIISSDVINRVIGNFKK